MDSFDAFGLSESVGEIGGLPAQQRMAVMLAAADTEEPAQTRKMTTDELKKLYRETAEQMGFSEGVKKILDRMAEEETK